MLKLKDQRRVMTKEAIHQQLHASPFHPFALRLTDGERVPVPHPDFVALSQGGRTVAVMAGGEEFKVLDLALVTALEMDSSAAPGTP
jgi:hypothetical protein